MPASPGTQGLGSVLFIIFVKKSSEEEYTQRMYRHIKQLLAFFLRVRLIAQRLRWNHFDVNIQYMVEIGLFLIECTTIMQCFVMGKRCGWTCHYDSVL